MVTLFFCDVSSKIFELGATKKISLVNKLRRYIKKSSKYPILRCSCTCNDLCSWLFFCSLVWYLSFYSNSSYFFSFSFSRFWILKVNGMLPPQMVQIWSMSWVAWVLWVIPEMFRPQYYYYYYFITNSTLLGSKSNTIRMDHELCLFYQTSPVIIICAIFFVFLVIT